MIEKAEKKEKKHYDEWEVNNAVDTLIKAEEIKKNKKLFSLALKEVKKKERAISSIAQLRELSEKS